MANETESKTYVFNPEGSNSNMFAMLLPFMQQRGIDPSILYAMKGNNGNIGDWIILLFFMMMFQNGWGNNNFNGNGAGGFISNQLANDTGRELIMQGLNGNQNAINQLANSLNTSISSVQSALNTMNLGIQNVGSQVGMSSQAVINAIQAGNCQLASQFAQCCCENKLLVTQSNYENQIATLNQTNQLGSQADRNNNAVLQAIANQTTVINEKFCDLEKRELTNKITELTAEKVKLQGEIVVLNQNNYIDQKIAAAVAELKSTTTPASTNA